jgi:hypothetical protein
MKENQSYSIKKQLVFDVIFNVNSLSVKSGPLSDDIHIESIWVGYKSINSRVVNVYVHEVTLFFDTDNNNNEYIASLFKELNAKKLVIPSAINMHVRTADQTYLFSGGTITSFTSSRVSKASFKFKQYTIGI